MAACSTASWVVWRCFRKNCPPAIAAVLNDYLEDVREIERRIQRVEEHNRSGVARNLPAAPVGVPDLFEDHVKLMFDLQLWPSRTDTTRVSTFR